jgi:Holliday junction resolvasome RuvABC endonuclease subunit
MSKTILAIDPGTIHTGFAKLTEEDGDLTVEKWGMVDVPKGLSAAHRINYIVDSIVELIGELPPATEIWTELFAPYGARRGMMWNASLVGAILYLPVTRRDESFVSYGVYPIQWREWVRTEAGLGKGAISQSAVEKLLQLREADYTKDIIEHAHVRDALCIGLFGLYGAETNEYQVSETVN